MELYAKLSQEFNGEEQQIFINNFKSYLTYNQDKDYVIDLEFITKFLGFTRKDHAKRILNKYLIENTDYKLLLPRSGEQDNVLLLRQEAEQKNNQESGKKHGGINKETILLTPNAFKDFCMRADTDKSRRIRQYYMKMESIMFQHLNELLTSANTAINDNKIEIQSLNDKVKNYERELLKYKHRIVKKYELGDCVYILKDTSKENIYKVGETENLNTRDSNYNANGITSKFVYIKRCKNRKVLESAVHLKLDKYNYDNRKDWFEIDFETIRNAIDELQLMLDGEEGKYEIIDDILVEENIPKAPAPPIEEVINKPSDYERFIEDCFIIDENEQTSWLDINSRYKLWSKCTDAFKDNLNDYMINKGFKKSYIYDKNIKTNALAYSGLKMKALPDFTINEDSSEIEKFVYKYFVPVITGRVASKDVFAKYIEWRQETDKNYTHLHKNDKKEINAYFQNKFYNTVVHNGERNRLGFFGLSFKGKENIGKRVNIGNRKCIEKVKIDNNEIVEVYDSITQASKEEGVSVGAMSTIITNRKISNGYLFRKKL
jgi:phage anti-repressor protein